MPAAATTYTKSVANDAGAPSASTATASAPSAASGPQTCARPSRQSSGDAGSSSA